MVLAAHPVTPRRLWRELRRGGLWWGSVVAARGGRAGRDGRARLRSAGDVVVQQHLERLCRRGRGVRGAGRDHRGTTGLASDARR
ncbi:MAG: hypothetical protein EPO65_04285 [Dehalococcoidia bacterium]|nr:MAG: hypothetical protein EPO65_04285 [Dehalococcoidia bacterium]